MGPGLVALVCVAGGGFWGMLPTALGYVISFSGTPLRFITHVPFPGNFVLSVLFGALVGILCLPVAIVLMTGRARKAVLKIVFGLVTPAVALIALLLATAPAGRIGFLGLLSLSGGAFLGAAILVSCFVPKVVIEPGLCRRCGYDLRGSLASGRCSECGLEFRPNEVA